jgi:hypothetical protein
MMDKNMLEFWGKTFLNAARSQQQMENMKDMNKMFGQNTSVDNPFMSSMLKTFGLQKDENKSPEGIAEFTKKAADTYKEFFQSYTSMFDVVSKEEYNKLLKENEELKEKIAEKEKTINSYQNLSGKEAFDQEQIVDSFTQIMKNQTQQFQDMMNQVNQYYAKGSPTKKK